MIPLEISEKLKQALVCLTFKTLSASDFVADLGEHLSSSPALQDHSDLVLLYGTAPDDRESLLAQLTKIVAVSYPDFSLEGAESAKIAESSLILMAKKFVETEASGIELCVAATYVAGAHHVAYRLSDVCSALVMGVHPMPTELDADQIAQIKAAAVDFLS